jgi:glycosyltransferase involved in cell wall biosynthesis
MDKSVYEKPLISVAMCTYNGLPYVREAVRSIINQTYSNWELIISDDGSIDGTREWLKDNFAQHPKVRLYFQEVNLGYVANKNYALNLAKGQFITQLDQDDLCTIDRLEKQVNFVVNDSKVRIIGSGFYQISESGKILDRISPMENTCYNSPDFKEYKFWFPSLMIHREVFDTLGYFNPYFSGAIGDDIYWTVQAIRHYPIFCLSEPLYFYRTNPYSITNTFTNPRRLIMPLVLNELFKQQEITGADWLQLRDFENLQGFEEKLLSNRVFMAQQYQISAARAIDNQNFSMAYDLLVKSFLNSPVNFTLIRTVLYFAKQKLMNIFITRKLSNQRIDL